MVGKEGACLFLTIGPKKMKMKLKPGYGDNFFASVPLGLDDEDWLVSFQLDAEGKAGTLCIEALNEDGFSGIFRRVE